MPSLGCLFMIASVQGCTNTLADDAGDFHDRVPRSDPINDVTVFPTAWQKASFTKTTKSRVSIMTTPCVSASSADFTRVGIMPEGSS